MQVPDTILISEQPGAYSPTKLSLLAHLIESYGYEHPELLEQADDETEAKAS